jgi:hypothetical protein
MLTLLRIIGAVVIAIGITVMVKPDVMLKMLSFWKRGKNIYLAAAIRLIFGILFIYASPLCRLNIMVALLGSLMIAGGVIVIMLGPKRMETIFAWWEKRPLSVVRLAGAVAFTLGALIIYSV